MARFFKLDRLTTGTMSKTQPIIFDGDALLHGSEVSIYDEEQRASYTATVLSVLGYPEYTFKTLTPLATVLAAVGGTRLVPGVPASNSCSVAGNILIATLPMSLPLTIVRKVRNKIKADTDELMINPNYIVYAEEQIYQDENTELETSGVLLVLNSTPPKQVPTNLALSDVIAFLNPITI